MVKNLAVFPYHGTAADHLRERSIDLLPHCGRARRRRRGDRADQRGRRLDVAGAGAVTLYGIEGTPTYTTGDAVAGLPA